MTTEPTSEADALALISAAPVDRRETMEAIHARVLRALPDAPVRAWGSIIGYGQYHYRYASGREGDWFIVGLANQKAHLSLYVSLLDGDRYVAETFADQLGKVSVGRSCIRFKRLDHLNLDAVDSMLARVAELMAGEPSFGQ